MHRSGPYLVEILQKTLVVVVPDTRWKARPSEQAPEQHTGPAVERRTVACLSLDPPPSDGSNLWESLKRAVSFGFSTGVEVQPA